MDTNPSLWGFIQLVSQLFNISEIVAAFWVGVGVVLLLAIIGRIFRVGQWSATRRAVNAPMQAFTTKTPFQVVREGNIATAKLVFTVILFLAVACGTLYLYLNQLGEAQTISQIIVDLLSPFLSP